MGPKESRQRAAKKAAQGQTERMKEATGDLPVFEMVRRRLIHPDADKRFIGKLVRFGYQNFSDDTGLDEMGKGTSLRACPLSQSAGLA
jgi:hypothetical protein